MFFAAATIFSAICFIILGIVYFIAGMKVGFNVLHACNFGIFACALFGLYFMVILRMVSTPVVFDVILSRVKQVIHLINNLYLAVQLALTRRTAKVREIFSMTSRSGGAAGV